MLSTKRHRGQEAGKLSICRVHRHASGREVKRWFKSTQEAERVSQRAWKTDFHQLSSLWDALGKSTLYSEDARSFIPVWQIFGGKAFQLFSLDRAEGRKELETWACTKISESHSVLVPAYFPSCTC